MAVRFERDSFFICMSVLTTWSCRFYLPISTLNINPSQSGRALTYGRIPEPGPGTPGTKIVYTRSRADFIFRGLLGAAAVQQAAVTRC